MYHFCVFQNVFALLSLRIRQCLHNIKWLRISADYRCSYFIASEDSVRKLVGRCKGSHIRMCMCVRRVPAVYGETLQTVIALLPLRIRQFLRNIKWL